MLRLLLALVLATACVPANAILLKIDYDLMTVLNASQWLLADPPPDQLHATFTIDTGSALSSQANFITDSDGDNCLGHMLFDEISISDIAVTSSNMSFGTSQASNLGRLFGDNPSPSCPGGFFGGLRFLNSDREFIGSIDFPGMAQADFETSADPMADLLASAVAQDINVQLIGNWGRLVAGSAGGTIQQVMAQVPAPAPIALFLAGLIGFAVFKRSSGKSKPSAVPAAR